MNLFQRKRYKYFYDTHVHTSEASACAKNTGAEMARAAKAAGYTGIIITDHAWNGNTCIDPSLPWETWVEAFCKGYENAKKEGKKIGLSVFFGYESNFDGTEFLIYGLDKEWLIRHPQIKKATVEQQFKMVHDGGGIVIQAHPYREADYIPRVRLYPTDSDLTEIFNGAHSSPLSTSHYNPDFDRQAVEYARKYGVEVTAGSDVHSVQMLGAGIAVKEKWKTVVDYIMTVAQNGDFIMCSGEGWYDRKLNPYTQEKYLPKRRMV